MDEDIFHAIIKNYRRQVVEAMDNVALAAAMQDESELRSEIIRERNERLNDLQMVCSRLCCTSKELVQLVMSGRIGYIKEQQDRPLADLAKLPTPFAPRPFVMPTDGRKWYKQFDNKKHYKHEKERKK